MCLFGQPRDYHTGFMNINKFINDNNNNTYSFFIHCWISDKIMNVSPYRYIDKTHLKIDNIDKLKNDILTYYNPKKYEFENTIDNFDLSYINNSIIINNTTNIISIQNKNNTLSQMYSRNKVRDLLEEYIKETNESFDIVIITRLDLYMNIKIKLRDLDINKTYVNNMYYLRKIIVDHFIICPLNTFLEWFKLYKNLDKIANDDSLNLIMYLLNEKLYLNPEEITTANYLYHFDINNIVYTDIYRL